MSWSTQRWEPIPLTEPSKVRRAEPARIRGLLYDGKRHVLFAEPEAAKTLIICMLILEFVRITPTGKADRWMHDVAYLDFENGRDALSLMLAELGATEEEVARVAYFEPRTPPTERDVYKISCEELCGLVVIDAGVGAANVSGLDDDKRKDIERMAQQWVTPFWESGCTTVVLEHVAKTSDGKWPIGSERKMGSCDTAYFIDPIVPVSRGTSGLYKIVARRDRGGYHKRGTVVSEVVVDSDPDTHAITWAFRQPAATASSAAGFRPTNLMERLSRQLELHPDGLTRTKLYKATQGKRQWLVVGLDALIEEGFIQDTGSLLVPVHPFREDDAGSPVPKPFPMVPDAPGSSGSPVPLSYGEERNGNGAVGQDEVERLATIAREEQSRT